MLYSHNCRTSINCSYICIGGTNIRWKCKNKTLQDILLECPRTSFRDVLRVNVTERVWHSPPRLTLAIVKTYLEKLSKRARERAPSSRNDLFVQLLITVAFDPAPVLVILIGCRGNPWDLEAQKPIELLWVFFGRTFWLSTYSTSEWDQVEINAPRNDLWTQGKRKASN